jgi:hypothetical protein
MVTGIPEVIEKLPLSTYPHKWVSIMQPAIVGWVRRGFLRRNPPRTHVGFRSAAPNLRSFGHSILRRCTKSSREEQ